MDLRDYTAYSYSRGEFRGLNEWVMVRGLKWV